MLPLTARPRTGPDAFGAQLVRLPVAVAKAASLDRNTPSTWVKSPPMYSVLPSAEGVMTHALASRLWLKGSRSPVEALKAARWLRGTSPVPRAAPGGRTEVKSPLA